MSASLAPAVNPRPFPVNPLTGERYDLPALPPADIWPGALDATRRLCAICPRVSLKKKRSASMQSQEAEMRALVDWLGLEVAEVIPWTGTATLKREDYWRRIMSGVKSRRYRHVIFWETGRISRMGGMEAVSRMQEIVRAGGDWYIFQYGALLKTPGIGPMMLMHFAEVAAMFIPNLRNAVNSGLRSRLNGTKTGVRLPISVGRSAQGLRWVEREMLDDGTERLVGEYQVVEGPTEWGTIEQAYQVMRQVRSLQGGAREMERRGLRSRSGTPFSATTFGALIRNQKYKGVIEAHAVIHQYTEQETRIRRLRPVEEREYIHDRVVRDPHLPADQRRGLIPDAEWQEANDAIAPRTSVPRVVSRPDEHMLRGLVVCAACRWLATSTHAHDGRAGRTRPIYRCAKQMSNPNARCPGCGVADGATLDREVWQDAVALIAKPGAIRAAWERQRANVGPMQERRAALLDTVAPVRDLWKAYVASAGALPVDSDAQKELLRLADGERAKIADVEAQVAAIDAKLTAATEASGDLADFQRAAKAIIGADYDLLTVPERAAAITLLDLRVELLRAKRAADGNPRRWRFVQVLLSPTSHVAVLGPASQTSHSYMAIDLLAAD